MARELSPRCWLVDGYNVLHAVLLGERGRGGSWWSEALRNGLLARAGQLADPGAEVWVVFDGARPDAGSEAAAGARVRQVFAPSADDWLVARVRQAPRPEELAVVTADRKLADRARQRGARVVSPGEFLARCGRSAPGGGAGTTCG